MQYPQVKWACLQGNLAERSWLNFSLNWNNVKNYFKQSIIYIYTVHAVYHVIKQAAYIKFYWSSWICLNLSKWIVFFLRCIMQPTRLKHSRKKAGIIAVNPKTCLMSTLVDNVSMSGLRHTFGMQKEWRWLMHGATGWLITPMIKDLEQLTGLQKTTASYRYMYWSDACLELSTFLLQATNISSHSASHLLILSVMCHSVTVCCILFVSGRTCLIMAALKWVGFRARSYKPCVTWRAKKQVCARYRLFGGTANFKSFFWTLTNHCRWCINTSIQM